MSAIIQPGNHVLFMKIGIHAKEPLESIIKRKLKEIDDAGMAFWGYGGSTCHPTAMVQPFAQEQAKQGNPIHLVMQKMDSNHWAEGNAQQYSIDGQSWLAVPKGIEVRGSRYALVIDDLQEADFDLPLTRTIIARGPSMGKSGRAYIQGRVDKACLELGPDVDVPLGPDEEATNIGLVATLKAPYAVFLK
ncbi:hypothetical protein [Noviluteimonas gilva]|uniref:Uncharacterized protein n=1 Tax=Noviluteimonas gilva TaxID=2682097 RepID=A0A7C9HMJ4_9GAMM|nr:hypothetical protein [Lysobacter gilvus]MUV14577.1 hypothetical protein [Lysobacter gilvus]